MREASVASSQETVTYFVMGQSNGWLLSHFGIDTPLFLMGFELIDPRLRYHVRDVNPRHLVDFGRFADEGPFMAITRPLATLGDQLLALEPANVSVEVVQMAVSGSALSLTAAEQMSSSTPAWLDPTGQQSLLGDLTEDLVGFSKRSDRVRVIWIHGETDTGLGTDAEEYQDGLTKLFSEVRRTMGRDSIEVFLTSLIDIPIDFGPGEAQVIQGANGVRDAQLNLHRQTVDGVSYRIVAHPYDLMNQSDGFHVEYGDRAEFARRIAQGIGDPSRYFEIVGHSVGLDRIDLSLNLPSLTASPNPLLFEVKVGGVSQPFTVSTGPMTISLQLPPGILDGSPVEVRHIYGPGSIGGLSSNWEFGVVRSPSMTPLGPYVLRL